MQPVATLQPQPTDRLEHKSRANGRAVVRAIEFFSLNLLSYFSFSFCKGKHIPHKKQKLRHYFCFFAVFDIIFADFETIFADFESLDADN
jgi:hypothetical protein